MRTELRLAIEQLNQNEVSELRLFGMELTDDDLITLSPSFTTNNSLTCLNLTDNKLSGAGIQALVAALESNAALKIKTLLLGFNAMGTVGMRALAQLLMHNTSITCLDITRNQINDAGAAYLAQALAVNHTLQNVSLSGNELGNKGIKHIATALITNYGLKKLDISVNNITAPGAFSLCRALKQQTTLQTIDFMENHIDAKGYEELRENKSLTTFIYFGEFSSQINATMQRNQQAHSLVKTLPARSKAINLLQASMQELAASAIRPAYSGKLAEIDLPSLAEMRLVTES